MVWSAGREEGRTVKDGEGRATYAVAGWRCRLGRAEWFDRCWQEPAVVKLMQPHVLNPKETGLTLEFAIGPAPSGCPLSRSEK